MAEQVEIDGELYFKCTKCGSLTKEPMPGIICPSCQTNMALRFELSRASEYAEELREANLNASQTSQGVVEFNDYVVREGICVTANGKRHMVSKDTLIEYRDQYDKSSSLKHSYETLSKKYQDLSERYIKIADKYIERREDF